MDLQQLPEKPKLSDFPCSGDGHDHAAFANAALEWIRARRALDELDRHRRCGIGRIYPDEPIELIPGPEGVSIARYSDDRGPQELRQHVKIRGYQVNEAGETRRLPRTQDLLKTMLSNGTITEREHVAGRKFARDFHVAQLDPRRAPDLRRLPGLPMGPDSDKILAARELVGRAMELMGGHGAPVANTAWWILGSGLSMSDYAYQEKLNKGRAVTRKLAQAFLISVLSLLAKIYEHELDNSERQKILDKHGPR